MENKDWGVDRKSKNHRFGFVHYTCKNKYHDLDDYNRYKGIIWSNGWTMCWWCEEKPPNWILFQVKLLNNGK